jgi:hypothetical protein
VVRFARSWFGGPAVDLRDCLRAARRHWWLVAATVLASEAVAATVTSFANTPSRDVTDSYQGGLFSQQRVKSCADLLTDDNMQVGGRESGNYYRYRSRHEMAKQRVAPWAGDGDFPRAGNRHGHPTENPPVTPAR